MCIQRLVDLTDTERQFTVHSDHELTDGDDLPPYNDQNSCRNAIGDHSNHEWKDDDDLPPYSDQVSIDRTLNLQRLAIKHRYSEVGRSQRY